MNSITHGQMLIVYIPGKEEGRGLMQGGAAYIVKLMKLMEYVEGKEDPLIQVVRMHLHNTNSVLFHINI
jgi:hypothetical protein